VVLHEPPSLSPGQPWIDRRLAGDRGHRSTPTAKGPVAPPIIPSISRSSRSPPCRLSPTMKNANCSSRIPGYARVHGARRVHVASAARELLRQFM